MPKQWPPPQLVLQQGRGPHRVDLAQDSALSKEEGFAGVHNNQVEIGPPGALWDVSLWMPGRRSTRGC